MQRQVGPGGGPHVAADSTGARHVAILAAADCGIVAAESAAHIDRSLGEFTHAPLAVGPFHRVLVVGIVGRVRRVEIDQSVLASLADIGRVRDIMAGAAQVRRMVEGGLEEGMELEAATEIVGSAPSIAGIDHVLAAVLRIGNLGQVIEDSEVDAGTLPGDVIGVDHPVAEVAGHTIKIVDATDRRAIGGNTVAGEPSSRCVTA